MGPTRDMDPNEQCHCCAKEGNTVLNARVAELERPLTYTISVEQQRDRYREALGRIARPLGDGCGCGGPVCHCFEPEAIRVELDARIDLAHEALK
jgi:hypothetical protein